MMPSVWLPIWRKPDIEGLLGTDLIVASTNAYSAYEWVANATFQVVNKQT